MPRWGIRTSSCAARSRACGPICHRTPSPAWGDRPVVRRPKRCTEMIRTVGPTPNTTTRQMTRNPIAPIAVISLAGVLTASLAGVFTASTGAPAPQTSGAQVQLATINQYCVGCHNDRVKTGGVSFEGRTPESIGQHAELFEKAVRKLRGGVMPPPGARQPEGKAIDSLVAWLEDSLDRAAGQ